MSVQKIGFSEVQYKPQSKNNTTFTSSIEYDEEKSNASKLMIGATALAAVAGLGIAGYKGHLGKGIQKFLGGAEKTAEKTVEKTVEKSTEKLTEAAEKQTAQVVSKTERTANEAAKTTPAEVQKFSGEKAVDKINEYSEKFPELNEKAFIPKNDKNLVIVRFESEKGIIQRTYKLKGFKCNATGCVESTPISERIINYDPNIRTAKVKSANGTEAYFSRHKALNAATGEEDVYRRTKVSSGNVSYEKLSNNKDTAEMVTNGKKMLATNQKGFEKLKEQVMQLLRK